MSWLPRPTCAQRVTSGLPGVSWPGAHNFAFAALPPFEPRGLECPIARRAQPTSSASGWRWLKPPPSPGRRPRRRSPSPGASWPSPSGRGPSYPNMGQEAWKPFMSAVQRARGATAADRGGHLRAAAFRGRGDAEGHGAGRRADGRLRPQRDDRRGRSHHHHIAGCQHRTAAGRASQVGGEEGHGGDVSDQGDEELASGRRLAPAH